METASAITPFSPPPFNWADFLHRHQDTIICEWVQRLHSEISERYSLTPESELRQTIAGAFSANCRMLIDSERDELDRFIPEISRLRLEGGFPLVDVQRAFDLFRLIVLPLLFNACNHETFYRAVIELNNCLACTTYQFSDLFQKLHRKRLIDYAQKLKEEVSSKTTELRESELKYKTLVEGITDGYVVIHAGDMIFTNRAFNFMHGYGGSELLKKTFLELVAPRDQAAILDQLYHIPIGDSASPVLEYSRMTRYGDTLPTEIKFKTVRYGNRWSQIGICRDITERIELGKKMRETERLADITQIVTSLSHEIRNPLSAIKMNLQILQRHPELVGNDRRRVDIAVNEMHRLEGVLQEILDFARPVTLEMTLCNLNSILMQVVELLEMKFAEKRLNVVLNPGRLPDVLLDGGKLEQVALNLLLNAVEAAPNGSIVRVRSYKRPPDSRPPAVVFEIENEGKAIPLELRETVFKPFFTTKSRGTGLGLSVVKRLVEAHGGYVTVTGRNTGGSIFVVALPEGDSHANDSCGG